MKVLKNNFNEMESLVTTATKIKPYPRKLTCDECGSELEYEKSDLRMGEYGYMFIDCPLCGYGNMLEDHELSIKLTKDNIEFPTHFHWFSKEAKAVDVCNNEYVKNNIKRAIGHFRTHDDEWYWYTGTGNTMIFVHKLDGDEEYDIYVTPDYYEMTIPFEKEDY